LSIRSSRNHSTGHHFVGPILAAVSLLLAASGSAASGQNVPLPEESNRLEVALERKTGEAWRTTDPGLVLQQNDEVRFRVSGNFDGYLYVMNLNTSGQYGLIFPREDTGQANKIETGKQYLIPATEGWFRITGPPGYEIVYWLVSPVELRHEPTDSKPSFLPIPAPQSNHPPAHLLPRCDDSIFKTRGDCIDTSAGAKRVGEAESLPDNLGRIDGAGRDLAFSRTENSTVIASPTSLKGPVIFVFRLAHR
jgi:hypothetical protein